MDLQHDNLRDNIGQAISDKLASWVDEGEPDQSVSIDPFDSRNIDDIADAVMVVVNAAALAWQPMRTAPKDGQAVLVLVEGSDIPRAVRWLSGPDDPRATEETAGPGWHLTWDGTPVQEHDGPRYWMHCPDDPDA